MFKRYCYCQPQIFHIACFWKQVFFFLIPINIIQLFYINSIITYTPIYLLTFIISKFFKPERLCFNILTFLSVFIFNFQSWFTARYYEYLIMWLFTIENWGMEQSNRGEWLPEPTNWIISRGSADLGKPIRFWWVSIFRQISVVEAWMQKHIHSY